MKSHHHAASGSSLRNVFTVSSAMQITFSITSTMNQRRRRDIIEPTLKASDRGPQHARFLACWGGNAKPKRVGRLNKIPVLAPQARA